ncbi:MAG: PAS domain-containing protein [Polynucleobacter sp.]|nr:PAS domain-containing protein [Polynucleobacter sp.]MDZ4056214.1 PAS domain-containing protein [Polynucleobacter sp.]
MKDAIDYKQLVHGMGDAVIVSDAQGDIVLWNKAAERIFGYTEAEALGKRLDLITPERFRHRHWEGYEKSMETGTTRYGTQLLKVPALHKDGRTLSIAFTVTMLFDEAHRATGVAATIRDETERFHTDRALRNRLSELESAANPGAPK